MKVKRLLFRGLLAFVALAILIICVLAVGFFWLLRQAPHTRVYFPKASINGHPVQMMLDTGSDFSFVSNRQVADRLGMEIEPASRLLDINGLTSNVWLSKPAEVQSGVDDITVPLNIYNDDRAGPIGHDYDLDIGWPSVWSNILVFDSHQHVVRAVSAVPPETSGWLKLPVASGDWLILKVPLSNGTLGSILVDTGNPWGVELAPQPWKEWRASHPEALASSLKLNFGANWSPIRVRSQTDETVWANEIQLGSLTLTDIPVFEDKHPLFFLMKDTPSKDILGGNYLGTIGLYALERMDLVVDGKNNVAYVKPKPPPGPAYPGFDRPKAIKGSYTQNWTVDASVRLQSDDFFAKAAQFKLENEDYDGALADASQASKLNPQNAEAYSVQGSAEIQNGNDDNAIRDFTRVLEINPQDAAAYANRGQARDAKNDYVGAIADYTQALSLDQKNTEYYDDRGRVKAHQSDFDGAVADFDLALAIDPSNAAFHDDLGDTKEAKGDYDGAIADYAKAIELNTKDGDYYNDRGVAKRDKGDYAGAIADFNHAIELDPKNFANYQRRGVAMQIQGDFKGAMANYDKAIKINSDQSPYAYLYRHVLQRQAGSAPSDFSKTVAHWPDGWPKSLGLYTAGTLDETGLLAAAVKGDAQTIHEQQCEVDYFIGETRLMAGDEAEARNFFQKCLATEVKNGDTYSLAHAELARLDAAEKK